MHHPTIVCSSTGGTIALQYAFDCPDDLSRLVLNSAVYQGDAFSCLALMNGSSFCKPRQHSRDCSPWTTLGLTICNGSRGRFPRVMCGFFADSPTKWMHSSLTPKSTPIGCSRYSQPTGGLLRISKLELSPA